jgi:hypothetical protein
MTDSFHNALALVATGWFKAARRARRIAERRRQPEWNGSARSAPTRRDTSGRSSPDSTSAWRSSWASPILPSCLSSRLIPEDFDTEKGLVARETIDPTILHDGRVLMRGKVVLAKGQ